MNTASTGSHSRVIAAGAAVAVGIALLPMPYSYYQLLRVLLCAACAYVAFNLSPRDGGWPFVLGVFAVLYNPLLPVHLGSKPLSTLLNVLTLGCLWFAPVGARPTGRKTDG